MSLHRLVYTSVPNDVTSSDIEHILDTSNRNNTREHLSGVLLFTADHFVQVIEGSCSALSQRLLRIGCDPRHHTFRIRSLQPIDARAFDRWGMNYVSHDRASLEAFRRFYPNGFFEPDCMTSVALIDMCLEMSGMAAAARAA